MFSPEQELFNHFYKFSEDMGFNTFDYLPPEEENAAYPFVIIGDTQLTTSNTKNSVDGSLILSIEFWNSADDRAAISHMMSEFLLEAIKVKGTKNYSLVLDVPRTDQRMITDYSVENQTLLHGMQELNFTLY